MSSVNKIILLGYVGGEPETKYTASGLPITSLSLATSETIKNKQTGEKTQKTEWHRITFFGKLSELVSQFVHKGSRLYVEGKIRTEKWRKDGDTGGEERSFTKIIADEVKFLSKAEERPAKQDAFSFHGTPSATQADPVKEIIETEDDISF